MKKQKITKKTFSKKIASDIKEIVIRSILKNVVEK